MRDYEKATRARLGWMLGDSIQIQVSWYEGVHPCPVCGHAVEGESGDHGSCARCGWESDGLQEDEPDFRGGANTVCLNDARENYARTGMADPLRHPERLRELIASGQLEPVYVGYCSVCSHPLPGYLNMGETCPQCGWADSPFHENNPDTYTGWLNGDITLSRARRNYRRHGRWQAGKDVDKPTAD